MEKNERLMALVIIGLVSISGISLAQSGGGGTTPTAPQGMNSTPGSHLPFGASENQFLFLTATGGVHFGSNIDAPKVWIHHDDGSSYFDSSLQFKNDATFNQGLKVSSNAISDLLVAHKIQSGDLTNGGGGLFVGPAQFFGGIRNTIFGFWNNAGGVIFSSNNVGIGLPDPTATLEVSSSAKVSGGVIAGTLTIPGTEIEEPLNAEKMNNITSLSNLSCSEGQLLTKDTNNTFKCVTVGYNGTFSCPAGEALIGFKDGMPQCGGKTGPGCRPVVDCVNREPVPGDMCQDGTVFIGYTPDGHVKMFATPCPSGFNNPAQWDGCSRCGNDCGLEWAPNAFDSYAARAIDTGIKDKVTGKANTTAIAALDTTNYSGWSVCTKPAAVYCEDLVAYGHSDWYLPATVEVGLFEDSRISYWDIYAYRNRLTGKLPNYVYGWTSTEHPTETYPPWAELEYGRRRALMYHEKEGLIGGGGQDKMHEYPAHCVRKEGCRAIVDCVNGNPSPGDMCQDGTVYAGLSPDGNVKMFTTPCDVGQTWDGCSTCVGARAHYQWSSWQSTTNITDPNTGKANSAALAAAGPDFKAAYTCENLVSNGYSDWYLPALNEILNFGGKSLSIGNFDYSWGAEGTGTYWSSTEREYRYAYTLPLAESEPESEGSYSYANKTISGAYVSLRCARKGVDSCAAASPAPGTVCADGTIFAGFTPDGNVKMYTTPCDAGMTGTQFNCTGTRSLISWNRGVTTWQETGIKSATTGRTNTVGLYSLGTSPSPAPYNAARYCYGLTSYGHNDWYLPARDEMGVLYANKAAIGGFFTEWDNQWYWSSTEYGANLSNLRALAAHIRDFFDGTDAYDSKSANYRIRCTRK